MQDIDEVSESLNLGGTVGGSQRRITAEQTHSQHFKG